MSRPHAPWRGLCEAIRASRARRWPLRAFLGGALVAVSWYGLNRPVVQRADVRVGDAVRRSGTPVLDRVVAGTTDLGSVYAVCGIAAALASAGRRRTAADVLAMGGLGWVVAQHSKTLVLRERPYQAHGVRRLIRPPTGSSYPSGHAAVGMAVMSLLAERSRGTPAARLLYAAGAYIGLSRVYVGVHYPTDVIGGAGFGLALAAAWRGPLAAAGRLVATPALQILEWVLPPAARLAAVAVLANRVRRATLGGDPKKEFELSEAEAP